MARGLTQSGLERLHETPRGTPATRWFRGSSRSSLTATEDGAFGWDGGFGVSWLVDPGRHLVTIVLTQRMFETPSAPQVHVDIQAAAREATT